VVLLWNRATPSNATYTCSAGGRDRQTKWKEYRRIYISAARIDTATSAASARKVVSTRTPRPMVIHLLLHLELQLLLLLSDCLGWGH
jgi:hypothetical protein